MVCRQEFEEALQYSDHCTLINLIESLECVDSFEDDKTIAPVILVVAYGRHDALDSLIQRSVTLNERDHRNLGVMHMAAITNDVASAEKLIASGFAINDDILDHPSPFWLAATLGNLEMVKFFVYYCVPIPRRSKNSMVSPLILASKNGHYDVVEYLIAEGEFDVEEGYIAMCNACQFSHYDVVQLLISKGFRIHPTSPENCIPPLCSAAANGDKQMIDLILSHSESVNVEDRDGVTPLMRAAENGHYSIAELLLERGSDVNHTVKSSYITAFDFTNEEDMLNLLSIYREKQYDDVKLIES